MTASSVTGVGNGAVEGDGKGSAGMSLGVSHLIGVRVVAAGRITLSSGTGTVTFPVPLTGSQSNYVVIPHAYNSTTVARATSLTDSSGNFVSFALAGGTTDVVHYIVVKIGFDG